MDEIQDQSGYPFQGDRTELQGDQYPKSLTEEEVRKIAREEAANALAALKDHIGSTGRRADGNVNDRDLVESVDFAEQQMRRDPE